MTKRHQSAAALLLCAVAASAQSIDFNMSNRQDQEVLEPDYIGWAVNQAESETKEIGDGISVTVAATGNATTLRAQWNKNTCKAGQDGQTGLRLLGDGVMAFIADEDQNTPNLTDTPTSITVTIAGLEAGEHSVVAYHVHKDVNSGAMPDITVDVNGQTALTGVKYGNVKNPASALRMADAPYSYVVFTVAEGEEVSITYTTDVESGKTYQSTNIILNGLLIDRSPLTAMDPQPGHNDFHVDADNGELTLQWAPATIAVSHKLVLGTDAADVAQSTAYVYEGKETSYKATGLSSGQAYYWRVDEVDAAGQVYKGRVWAFRPRHLAFPGAEGYGRFALGGRGGVVYHVTNLSNDHEPGSLVYGLVDMEGPRTIVFDVSGIIEMDFGSQFIKPYATIAGQTAPGKGICLKASNVNIGSDVICRFMRFKRGLGVYGENTGNAMGMTGADHAIVDHCTAAWGTDETVSGRGAKNISFQYSVIAEALGIAGHKNYADGTNHGYAATIDGQIGSWHHNLLANCAGRNWSMGGGMDANNIPIGGLDLFNNVCYNWNTRTTDGNCHAVNFVNNYYKMGVDTKKTLLFSQDFEDAISPDGVDQAYIRGNIRENKDHSLTNDALNVTYTATGNVPSAYQYRVSEPLFQSFATIHSAKDAMKIVTSYAGATMPMRDEHHERLVRETLDGTWTYKGSKSGIRGEIDNEADITEHTAGWEAFPEEKRSADWDTDQDGMPDWWESLNGSNPATADNNDDPDGDGYTRLEDYLEFMAHPYVALEANGSASLDLKPYFAGFYGQNGKGVTPTYSLDEDMANGIFAPAIDGSLLKINAMKPDAAGVYFVDVTVNDGETTFTQRFGIVIAGNPAAIMPTWQDDTDNVVEREFFTLDGKKTTLREMMPHSVYMMKTTHADGTTRSVKIIN